MASTEYGVYHLADNPQAYQPMRVNNFRFLIQGNDNISKLLRVGGNVNDEKDSIAWSTAQEVLDFSVVSFNPPHFKQDEVAVSRGNSTIYFAGKASFSENSLVINDFAGADGKSILEAWQNLSYNIVDDTIPSSDKYKIDAVVLEYLPDNTLVKYWELKGCWVKGLDETGWNNEGSDKKQITATIRYDRGIPHMPD